MPLKGGGRRVLGGVEGGCRKEGEGNRGQEVFKQEAKEET